MYTIRVADRMDVFHTESLEFARSVFREWVGHSTNPNSIAYELCVMLFSPSGAMVETSVTEGLDNSV